MCIDEYLLNFSFKNATNTLKMDSVIPPFWKNPPPDFLGLSGQKKKKKKKKKKILFKVEQNCKYNTSEFAITSTSHTICTTKYTI